MDKNKKVDFHKHGANLLTAVFMDWRNKGRVIDLCKTLDVPVVVFRPKPWAEQFHVAYSQNTSQYRGAEVIYRHNP